MKKLDASVFVENLISTLPLVEEKQKLKVQQSFKLFNSDAKDARCDGKRLSGDIFTLYDIILKQNLINVSWNKEKHYNEKKTEIFIT